MKYINKSFLVLSVSILACSVECSQKSDRQPSQLEKYVRARGKDQEESEWERHVRLEKEGRLPISKHRQDGPDLRDIRDRPTPPGAFPADFPYAGSAEQADDIMAGRHNRRAQSGYHGPIGLAQQHEQLESRERLLDAHDDQLARVNQGNANHHQRLDTHDQKIAQLTRQFAALQSTVMAHTQRLDLHAGLRRADDATCIEHETRLETLEKQQEQLQGQVKEIAAEQAQIRIWRIGNKQDDSASAAAGK